MWGRGDDFLPVLQEEGFHREGSRAGGTFPAGAGNTGPLVPAPWPGPPLGLHQGEQAAPQLQHPSPRLCPLPLGLGAVFLDLFLSHDARVCASRMGLPRSVFITHCSVSLPAPPLRDLPEADWKPGFSTLKCQLTPSLTSHPCVCFLSLSSHPLSSTPAQDPSLCQTLGWVLARQP